MMPKDSVPVRVNYVTDGTFAVFHGGVLMRIDGLQVYGTLDLSPPFLSPRAAQLYLCRERGERE